MSNRIDQELRRMEVPKEVTERVQLGVKKAMAEQRSSKRSRPIIMVAALFLGFAMASVAFAYPSVALQLPFIENVFSFFVDEERDYENMEMFSTELGLVEKNDQATVLIDHAVYDGTTITVSYAVETESEFGKDTELLPREWFNVNGAEGLSSTDQLTQISDSRFVGLVSLTPSFPNDRYPDTVDITWEPRGFDSVTTDWGVDGDWSFAFSLDRLDGVVKPLHYTVEADDVTFTLQSMETTNVSTIIRYEQVVSEELLEEWKSVTPIFHITDDLGKVYMDGGSGSGVTPDNGRTFRGMSEVDRIQDGASELVIRPIQIASLHSGEGRRMIELEPIVIELGE